MINFRTLLAVLCLLASGLTAAETLLNYTITGGLVPVQRFYISDGWLRSSYTESNYYLYDGRKNELWMVDSGKKVYYPIGTNLLGDTMKTVAKEREKLEKLLASTKLPAAAVKALESALKSLIQSERSASQLQTPKLAVSQMDNTGKTDQHLGSECELYDVTMNRQQASVCYGVGKVAPADIAIFNGYHAYLSKVAGINGFYALLSGKLPLNISIASQSAHIALTSAGAANMGATFYRLPAGYRNALD